MLFGDDGCQAQSQGGGPLAQPDGSQRASAPGPPLHRPAPLHPITSCGRLQQIKDHRVATSSYASSHHSTPPPTAACARPTQQYEQGTGAPVCSSCKTARPVQ
uniref:Uncharacterized protein n=1 Tax=Chlamydomonas leiostraca TaxID=1034604 RepID=A0A7S0RIA3_9CHLO|mmetsp:Transcript_23718/g.60552  ORF Transcript_23718/g.60552 Transcript_23718/m.60552 type:complete len:103 (+) Transcript_23718:349-657(+)